MKIALLYTGCASEFTSNAASQLAAMYPGATIEEILVTWKGMNGPGLEDAFPNATIFEHDNTLYQEEIERVARLFLLRGPETKPANSVSMFYNWKLAREALRPLEADLFVKCRLDNKILALGRDHRFLDCDGLLIPSGGDWRGGIGDQFCAGSKDDVMYYLSVFDSLPQYAALNTPCHPEMLLRFHLVNAGKRRIERAPMLLVFNRRIYNMDSVGAERSEDAREWAPTFSFADLPQWINR